MKLDRSDEHATLVRYFLGELPPEERDLIEERYMIDDGYSERLDQAEADPVDAYVADTITSEQRRHFESRYLVTRDRREAVQAAFLSRAYRERVAKSDSAIGFNLWGWRVFLVPALAAALVIAGMAGVSWRVFRHAPPKLLVQSRPLVPNAPKPGVGIGPLPAVVTASPRRNVPMPLPPVSQSVTNGDRTRPAPEPVPEPPVIASLPPSTALATALPPRTITSSAVEDIRPRVAVDAFDYSAVIPTAMRIFNPELESKKKVTTELVVPNIGAGIKAMLILRLSAGGHVIIVDKDKFDEIGKLQTDGISNRNQPGKGARPGRIRAPDLLLAGNIVVFGLEDERPVSGFGASSFGNLVFGGSIGIDNKAWVKVTYRLVDGETGEVVESGDAEGHSIRKSKGIGSIAAANGGIVLDTSSANFAQTIIGEATVECVKNLAESLDGRLATMKYKPRYVEGMVAAVSGNTLILNVGSNEGVNVGDLFAISKSSGDVKDPVTGEVIDRILKKKGEMTVTTVKERVAIGTYSGAPAEPKDIARRKSASTDRH